MPKDPNRVWHYYFDAEGVLWHEGTEFDDPTLIHFFLKNLKRLPDGRLHLSCQGEDCYFTCEDVPYVVQEIVVDPHRIELVFPGDYRETLDPSTLHVGKENVLYCGIRGGLFEARFSRKSYYNLAGHIRFDPKLNDYYLILDKKRFVVKGIRGR